MPAHVDTITKFQQGVWVRDLVDETHPGPEEEHTPDGATQGVRDTDVERGHAVRCQEGRRRHHGEEHEPEAAPVALHVFLIQLLALLAFDILAVRVKVTPQELHLVFNLVILDDPCGFLRGPAVTRLDRCGLHRQIVVAWLQGLVH